MLPRYKKRCFFVEKWVVLMKWKSDTCFVLEVLGRRIYTGRSFADMRLKRTSQEEKHESGQ
jgi:hypothetical protein